MARGYALVTGGAGFIGSHVVDRCIKEGFDVTVVDNLYTGSEVNFSHHLGNPQFHFMHHDITQPLPAVVVHRQPGTAFSLIFHLACAASPVHYQSDPIKTTLTCVNGTHHVLSLATQLSCPVVIASTSEVYGDPEVSPQDENYRGNVNCIGVRSCYDEGKRCAESLAFDFHRQHGTRIRVARIFNTYGPRMCFGDGRVVSNFIHQALTGQDITIWGTGDNTRSFQYIDDLVDALWAFGHAPDAQTGPLNIGNPEEYSVRELAGMVLKKVPASTSKVVYLPPAEDDPRQRLPDITAAKAALRWEPKVGTDEGLQRTVEDFAARLKQEVAAVAEKRTVQNGNV